MIKKIQSFITGYFRRYKRLDRFSARFAILTAMIGLFVLALFFNLFKLMVFEREENQQRATSQQLKTTIIPANRGAIYDSTGEKLVQSAAAWVVVLDPKAIHEYYETVEQEEICHQIAEILGISYDTVLDRSNMNSSSAKIMTKAD